MNLVNSLLQESAQNAYTSTLTVAQRLVKKWGKSGLLKNLNEHDARNMAMILENQSKQLVTESSSSTGGVSNGATFTAGNGEQWAGVALPLVRKIFGQLASKEFVSVQPMNLPAGLVFYLDFQYGTTNPEGFTAGNSLYGNRSGTSFSNDTAGVALPLVRKIFGQLASKEFVSVQPMNLPAGLVFYLDFQYGTTNPEGFTAGNSLYGNRSGTSFSNDTVGGLYGAGKFGYSLNVFSGSGTGTVTSASLLNLEFDTTYSASIAAQQIKAIAIPTSSIPNFNPLGVRAFSITSGSSVGTQNTIAQATTLSGGNIVFFVSGSTATIPDSRTYEINYNKATDFNKMGDFEDRTATQGVSVPNAYSPSSISIPEVNVQMVSQTISAKTRKLKAQWTPEFAQDLNAYHSLDAEAELTGILSEYITLEIDLEVLDMLIQSAPTRDFWSAKVGEQINSAGTAFESNVSGVYYTQMSWFQTIGIKLQKLSNVIHQKTMRGGANFMVVSPAVATILESIPGFAADTDGAADTMKYAFGVQKIGALNSRYKVYKNPYMTENVILMGFRGNQFLESGAVYAPYVPLIMTPLVYDPNTFTPRKGIMTRYAMTMVRPEFYANLFISDLQIV